MSDIESLIALIKKEDWELKNIDDVPKVIAYGQTFDVRHPVQIYLRLYRTETDPESKYLFMKAAHDYLWPDTVWHSWTEDRFREHCYGWNYMSWAAGASASKSYDAAKIADLFWLANPQKRGVVIASTTLESLGARIWGYATDFLSKMAVKLPFQYLGGNSPKVLYPTPRSNTEIRDTIHGMFAVAAKGGDAEKSIASWIGRHPKDALMLVLDESTDITAKIISSFANLDSGGKPFQCISIGNSNSVDDLHGAMSTPKPPLRWEDIDPLTMKKWETTRKNGVCLFFSCYESPAIHETNPEKKKKLSKFLITEETIEGKKRELGETSDAFYRFVLGFWKMQSTEDRVLSTQFLTGFGAGNKTEWGGMYPLSIIGGLDTAFSTGGDECILRLAILGYDINGLLVLDFQGEKLTFKIPIFRDSPDDASIQIGKRVIKLLDDNRCGLDNVALDATGQGRAMGGVLQLLDKNGKIPISIYSTKIGAHNKDAVGVTVKSSYDLWYTLREFIQNEQIRGLDNETMVQLSSRQVVKGPKGQISLESKRDYKMRMGAKNPIMAHSPDKADAAALAVQAAILRYGFSIGKRKVVPKAESFEHLKLLTHRQEQEERGAAPKKNYSPVANFTGNLEDIKRRLF